MSNVERTKQKVVRGGGTVEQYHFMKIMHDARRMVKTYMGSDGNEYPNTKFRKWDNDGKILAVNYQPKEWYGIDYLTTLITQPRTDYSIVRTIQALRHPSVEDLLRLTHGNQPVTVAVTVYDIHSDKHVKLYQHPDGPNYDASGNETNYPVYQQWLNSWKNRIILMPNRAKEFRNWMARNKSLMDTIEAKYVLKQSHSNYIRLKADLNYAKMDTSRRAKELNEFGHKYATHCEEWEAEEAWFKAAPKHLNTITRNNLKSTYTHTLMRDAPKDTMVMLERNLERANKKVKDLQGQIDTLAHTFGGEEE